MPWCARTTATDTAWLLLHAWSARDKITGEEWSWLVLAFWKHWLEGGGWVGHDRMREERTVLGAALVSLVGGDRMARPQWLRRRLAQWLDALGELRKHPDPEWNVILLAFRADERRAHLGRISRRKVNSEREAPRF